jgi:hypothetical protein
MFIISILYFLIKESKYYGTVKILWHSRKMAQLDPVYM